MGRRFTTSTTHLILVLGLLALSGCFGNYPKSSSHDTGPNSEYSQRGIASWYGPSFHGKLSASGEPYDMWALTAAHQTLPFGTWVQVHKIATGKTVTVRINDRGPFIGGRIIDLSYAAARELMMIGEGTAEVSLTILSSHNVSIPPKDSNQEFWVQAGSFGTLTEAMSLREQLATDYSQVRVKTVNLPSGEWHRVQVGAFPSKKTAEAIADTLNNALGIHSLVLTSN
ncbi:MAG: septal ring lytic transglycosylase RlpA family protein [Nitrospirota bacterium]|nr:septal ring lytic transglycosylase RlpA family protein [Nitrospirota bacterium]